MDVASATTRCSSSSWTTASSCRPRALRKRTVVQGEAFYDTLTVPMHNIMPRMLARAAN